MEWTVSANVASVRSSPGNALHQAKKQKLTNVRNVTGSDQK
jgi:hypothetical protein